MYQKIIVENLDIPELELFGKAGENKLRRLLEPEPGYFIAESPRVAARALRAGFEPVSVLAQLGTEDRDPDGFWDNLPDIPVYLAKEDILSNITGFALTRGLLCLMRRKRLPSVEEICAGKSRIVVLENVENPTNVGAIFRSAAALGMEAVLLSGGCSDPLYRRCLRVSMGTVLLLPWTYLPGEKDGTATSGIRELRNMGFVCTAMALRENSLPPDDPGLKADRMAIVMGTEGDGLCDATIKACDHTVMIPMADGVDSLNVAAASAVAFWELGKR